MSLGPNNSVSPYPKAFDSYKSSVLLPYKPTRLGYPNISCWLVLAWKIFASKCIVWNSHVWSYHVDSLRLGTVFPWTAWYLGDCWGMLPAGDPLKCFSWVSCTLTFSHDKELSLFSTFHNTPLETDSLKSTHPKRYRVSSIDSLSLQSQIAS